MSVNKLKEAASGKSLTSDTSHRPPTLSELLNSPKMKAQLALALPAHLTADRLARIAITELRKVPKLGQCDQTSFLGAIMQCAQLGLEPGGSLGHAWLIPFDKKQKVNGRGQSGSTEVQLIIGWRGMMELARRSGQVLSISARAVYEHDSFHYVYGLHEQLDHIPCESGERGELTHVYAVCRLKDGGVQFEVMSRAEIEKVQAKSKSGHTGPWVDYFEEMARKTAIRRLFKYLPVSVEIQQAVVLDERAEAGVSQDNTAVLTGEYSVTVNEHDDEVPQGETSSQPVNDDRKTEAASYMEALINSVDASAPDRKEIYEQVANKLEFLRGDLDDESYQVFQKTLSDIKADFV